MQPFILRFGIRDADNNPDLSGMNVTYDVRREANVLFESGELLVCVPGGLPQVTGTYVTRAGTDPTADEPTDR